MPCFGKPCGGTDGAGGMSIRRGTKGLAVARRRWLVSTVCGGTANRGTMGVLFQAVPPAILGLALIHGVCCRSRNGRMSRRAATILLATSITTACVVLVCVYAITKNAQRIKDNRRMTLDADCASNLITAYYALEHAARESGDNSDSLNMLVEFAEHDNGKLVLTCPVCKIPYEIHQDVSAWRYPDKNIGTVALKCLCDHNVPQVRGGRRVVYFGATQALE